MEWIKGFLLGLFGDTKAQYSSEYDAFYKNGKWIEKVCKDPKCSFCKNRPLKPPE